jgi:hypothetical protein
VREARRALRWPASRIGARGPSHPRVRRGSDIKEDPLIDSDGLPFTLRSFRVDARVTSLDEFIDADAAGTPVPVDRSGAASYQRKGLIGLEVLSFA